MRTFMIDLLFALGLTGAGALFGALVGFQVRLVGVFAIFGALVGALFFVALLRAPYGDE